jgi:hypothetical protein
MRRHSAVNVAEINPIGRTWFGNPASLSRFTKSPLFQKLVMKETVSPLRASPWPNSKAMASLPDTYPAPQTITIGDRSLTVISVFTESERIG